MNEFLRCRRDCFVGMKAFQNLRASLLAFERLCMLANCGDHFLLSSFFYMGVMRYAKPFLNTHLKSECITYPIKNLKKVLNFSINIHDHIIEIRNTLVTHDDFEQIEPRLLYCGLNLEKSDFLIITNILLANKCISYPSDLNGMNKIKDHIAVTFNSIQDKLLKRLILKD